MKYHNIFNNLEYRIKTQNGEFFVTREKSGKHTIKKKMPYYITDAALIYHDADYSKSIWLDLPTFESFIHAVSYLKNNIEYIF